MLGINGANASHTESFYLREFAWIQNKALGFDAFIEF
jgi:hypothetical protein